VVLALALALALALVVDAGIYPADHFQYATKIEDQQQYDAAVNEAVNGEHTLFIRWIASEG
jgi:hypothetical protein